VTWQYIERVICDGDDCTNLLEGMTENPVQRHTISTDLLEACESRGWMVAREANLAYCPMHAQLYITAWSRDPD